MTNQRIVIDNDLNTDSAGAIKTYLADDIDGKRKLLELWFSTMEFSIPFLQYGNSLNSWLFDSMNINDIESKIDDLMIFFRDEYGFDVMDETHEIDLDNKKIKMNVVLRNNYNLSLNI